MEKKKNIKSFRNEGDHKSCGQNGFVWLLVCQSASHHWYFKHQGLDCSSTLKQENFMYDEKGSNHLKLIDFGFSKAWDPEKNKKLKMNCVMAAEWSPRKCWNVSCGQIFMALMETNSVDQHSFKARLTKIDRYPDPVSISSFQISIVKSPCHWGVAVYHSVYHIILNHPGHKTEKKRLQRLEIIQIK